MLYRSPKASIRWLERIRAFSHDGTQLLYHPQGANSPNDLWAYDFASQKAAADHDSLVGGVRSEDMVEPFLVHYPSKDGKWQISAFVYVPYNARRTVKMRHRLHTRRPPVADHESFNRGMQYLVNQGYFVITPNYRGSTGYGKEFLDANRFDMGGGDLEDVISAAEWIKKTGYIDPKKVAVMGGSYGGYLTMMAVTKAPDRWAAGVPIVPFVNWFTEIENADPRCANITCHHGRSDKGQGTIAGTFADQLCRPDQSAAACCWPAATIRAARRPKPSRLPAPSKNVAAWQN